MNNQYFLKKKMGSLQDSRKKNWQLAMQRSPAVDCWTHKIEFHHIHLFYSEWHAPSTVTVISPPAMQPRVQSNLEDSRHPHPLQSLWP